ncbi:DUF6414 family protein [Vagococcus salmoninarum]|uniref:Uncharacterized protein n=1 Tax=Vagococcus salmoninarum TaxID=2739 RepID=A0A429ZSE9_9ENTE|nr:hypothetical protein [Vagococcus salmoninarum]RST96670.1 hypothetical protein CBF35_05405 [Vagococcus salmoninarum]
MKDFLYLDTNLVNSYLAQIDSGLLQKMTTGGESLESNSENGGNEISQQGGGKLSIPGIAETNGSLNKKEIDTFSQVFSSKNSELVETALHDYSFDILLNRMIEKGMICSEEVYLEGSFVSLTGAIDVVNFEQLNNGSTEENISLIHREDESVEKARIELKNMTKKSSNVSPTSQKGIAINELKKFIAENEIDRGVFDNIARFGKYANYLFPETFLVKIDKLIGFCSNDNLRMNIPSLTISGISTREATIVGVVMSQKRSDSLVPEGGMPTDTILKTAPAIQMDIMLSEFELAEKGDYYVRPIAVYFETSDTY